MCWNRDEKWKSLELLDLGQSRTASIVDDDKSDLRTLGSQCSQISCFRIANCSPGLPQPCPTFTQGIHHENLVSR